MRLSGEVGELLLGGSHLLASETQSFLAMSLRYPVALDIS